MILHASNLFIFEKKLQEHEFLHLFIIKAMPNATRRMEDILSH